MSVEENVFLICFGSYIKRIKKWL